MADFTRAQVASETYSPTMVGEPQRAPSAVATAAGFLTSMMPSKQQIDLAAKNKRQASANTVTAAFTQEALKLADAVDMGEISSRSAESKIRMLYGEYLTGNEQIKDELDKAHQFVMTAPGLGKIITEGTDEERREKAYEDKVYEAGFIRQGMTDEEREAGIDNFREFEQSKRMLEVEANKLAFANSELANISSRLSIQSSRNALADDEVTRQRNLLGLQADAAKFKAEQAMASMSSAASPMFRDGVNEIVSNLGPSPTPEQRNEAIFQIQSLWGETYGAVLQGLGSGAETSQIEMITKPMKDWMEFAIKAANGEQSLESLKRAGDASIARQSLIQLGDPDLLRLASLSSLLGEQVAMLTDFNTVAAKHLAVSLDSGTIPAPSDESLSSFLKLSGGILREDAGNKFTNPQSSEEAATNYSNILLHVAKSSYSPEELNSFVDMVASSDVAAYVEAGKFTGDVAQYSAEAMTAFDEYYVQQVVPLIRERWQQATFKDNPNPRAGSTGAFGGPRTSRETPNSFSVSFVGETVVFKPKGVVGRSTGTQYDPSGLAQAEAFKMNKEISPVLGKIIRMGSHLDGHTDYRKYFEQNYRQLFETEVEIDGAEGDEG